jgi:biopolymer transport protein ExbD
VAVSADARYLIDNKPLPSAAPQAFAALQQPRQSPRRHSGHNADAGASHQFVVNVLEAARPAGQSHLRGAIAGFGRTLIARQT